MLEIFEGRLQGALHLPSFIFSSKAVPCYTHNTKIFGTKFDRHFLMLQSLTVLLLVDIALNDRTGKAIR